MNEGGLLSAWRCRYVLEFWAVRKPTSVQIDFTQTWVQNLLWDVQVGHGIVCLGEKFGNIYLQFIYPFCPIPFLLIIFLANWFFCTIYANIPGSVSGVVLLGSPDYEGYGQLWTHSVPTVIPNKFGHWVLRFYGSVSSVINVLCWGCEVYSAWHCVGCLIYCLGIEMVVTLENLDHMVTLSCFKDVWANWLMADT